MTSVAPPCGPSVVPRERLASGARALGITLSQDQLDHFDAYAAALEVGSRRFNLTAVTDPVQVAEKHFLDSLTVLSVLPRGALHLIDVGTGAGFPGLALKIARPEISVTLLEATGKKVAWLRETVEMLGLGGLETLAERSEALAHDPIHRGRYDIVTARAVAPLAVLCELCLPFLRPGGRFIAQKSASGAEFETPAARRALSVLGGRVAEVRKVNHAALPNRVLVVIEQNGAVPSAYPRRPGLPAKQPL
ncbi:MAG TPA: 16S rRNA (guanine(527)-N(7))-methyltransferase RsmG [Chloroflexota bacterium]|nr:16S rRNA (guanine(527)-N(7))-methyltransferase RsmG [Chloroflexota bacterium]